jgi:uncharacterized protein (DUF4415 family)
VGLVDPALLAVVYAVRGEDTEITRLISALPDSKIDYSDIPKSGAHVKWSRPGALVPAGNKLQVTLRLDADVLSFFMKTGQRYQTRINGVLDEYMQAHRKWCLTETEMGAHWTA